MERIPKATGSFVMPMKAWGGLAIGLLDGSGVVLEYRQPQGLMECRLIVSQAVQGYRSLLKRAEEVDEEMNVQVLSATAAAAT